MSLSSADIKFGEILPISKDHSVYDVTAYASKITGGKGKKTTQKRNRKLIGGNLSPFQFSEFIVETPATSINHPAISSALGNDEPASVQATSSPSEEAIPSTATATTVGGSSAAKRRQRKSKRNYKKGSKRSNKRSAKKYSRRRH